MTNKTAAFRLSIALLQIPNRLNLFLRHNRSRIPTKPVFVVCMLRTGSNLLLSYLNSISGVSIAGEILHPDQVAGVPRTAITRSGVMKHIRRSLNQCDAEICGAKLPSIHLDFHNLNVKHLHDYFPTSKVILLYRRSIADQFLSYKMALLTKRWRVTNGQDPLRPSQKVQLDRTEFLKYAAQIKQFYSATLALDGIRSYTKLISYEELVAQPRELFETKLFPFLGVPPAAISTNQVKGIKGHPSEVVDDYESVRDFWEDPDFIQEYQL